jgi:uroporphyrinogen-III synthase
MRLLVTRPEEGGKHTAEILRARGHDVLLSPLLRIEPLPEADLGATSFAAVIISSANAARAIAAHRRMRELAAVPVLAVGDRTADVARAAGFSNVQSARGDAGDLAALAVSRFGPACAPLLYLAGEDRARDLAAELPGTNLHTVVVYRAAKVDSFPSPVMAAFTNGKIDGVLHFSLRTAEAFMECVQTAGLQAKALALFHYCLSARVAGPLAGAANLRVARRPDEAALLDLVGTA